MILVVGWNVICKLWTLQDDVVMGTLTVRENLMFSANLRLPESIPIEEKQRRVNAVQIMLCFILSGSEG